jgi:chromosome segregation protein
MLKSLEMFGFKSFADRTRFDFAPGITCVVGPNGSGKSNVVDAIKWILGDQSPKSLRGKEMTDVIFNGSASRKPAGFGEATLTFDNSKRVLSVDADEVHIGRRIYRSGEGEYLINRLPARLKDVKDLFLGTGAGTSAYSIIEQGRVDQLLQATNVNRRNVFEEAAGISRFRVKKVDAQRKLDRVSQNLLRLTDIVAEVETRLNQTRNQASKAAKFREYSQELRELRLGLAADDYRELTARFDDIDRDRAELQQQIDLLAAEARECEQLQQSAEGRLSGVEDALRAAERREAENREAIAGQEATLRHQQARHQELDADRERLQKQQTDLAGRAHQVAGELEQTVGDLERFTAELERRQQLLEQYRSELERLTSALSERREAVERGRHELLDAVRESSMLANRVTGLEAQMMARGNLRRRAEEQTERFDAELTGGRANQRRLEDELTAESHALQALRDEIGALQTRRAELTAHRSELQQRLVDAREERGAIQARKSLLEDLERRQEGIGVGAREILALARTAGEPPWTSVLGHVVDLLEVDFENAALLEVALGARAQLIVLAESEPLLDYLREGRPTLSGRVGFLTLWRDTGEPAGGTADDAPAGVNSRELPAHDDLTGCAGVVCRADRLVRSASGIHRLAEQLLSDTWIVASLEAALKLAETAASCRFVTLQGELLEAGGTLHVGPMRSETAVVSRKSELRGVRNELARLERSIAGDEDALERGAAEARDLETQLQNARLRQDDAVARVGEIRTRLGHQELELERLERSRSESAAEATTAAAAEEELNTQLDEARQLLSGIESRLADLQQGIDSGETGLAQEESRQQELQTLFAFEQRELAKYEERRESLLTARNRLDEERFQRDLHREEADRRLQMLVAKRDQIALEVLNTEAALTELVSRGEGLAQEVGRLQEEREQARRGRGELVERDLRVRHRLRDCKESLHGLEMRSSEIRNQLANLAERLRDEYQVELTELAETGISARTSFFEGREAGGDHGHEAASPDDASAEGAPLENAPTPQAGHDASAADPVREQIDQQIQKLRRKLKQLGHVNADSLKELDELEARFARISGQLQDLVEAKNTLEEIIRRINSESRRLFVETFEQIRGNFRELFRKLFGGGEGDVVLEDPNDVLECGIDIVARPPGKELRSISLLSGGEKTMTAVALLLAIFKSKPSPFCILDEVDAALDEGNVNRYMGVIKEFQQFTQFIVTHSKRTMSAADVLYGVTMEEAGISKRMSVRFEDVSEDGHFKPSAKSDAA